MTHLEEAVDADDAPPVSSGMLRFRHGLSAVALDALLDIGQPEIPATARTAEPRYVREYAAVEHAWHPGLDGHAQVCPRAAEAHHLPKHLGLFHTRSCRDTMTPYRLLLTGMSGTGKSTLVATFRAHGVTAIDMDEPGWSFHDANGHQHWDEERLDAAFAAAGAMPLVIAGCAETQVLFYPRCTHVVLLTAPWAVMRERIETRTGNPYGKRPEELAAILRNRDEIEPLLRRRATLVIDTAQPLAAVLAQIQAHVDIPMDQIGAR